MAFSNLQLFAPVQLPITTPSVQYTVPVNRVTVVTRATFINNSANAVTIDAYLVPNGGSPVDANQVITSFTLDSNETFSSPDIEGQVLPAQSTIQMNADAATAITAIFSGIEIA